MPAERIRARINDSPVPGPPADDAMGIVDEGAEDSKYTGGAHSGAAHAPPSWIRLIENPYKPGANSWG